MRKIATILLLLIIFGFARSYAQFIPFDNYTVKESDERKKLKASYLYDIEQDQQGYLWFASQIGVMKYDGYSFKQYTTTDGLPDNNISDVFIDSRNRIWIATETAGLAILDRGELSIINTLNGLVSNEGIELLENANGDVYYFSKQGVSIFRNDTIINYGDISNSILGARIIDSDGNVWSSSPQNLYHFHESSVHQVSDSLTISDITENKPGSIWLATEKNGAVHITIEGDSVIYAKSYLPGQYCRNVESIGHDTIIATTQRPSCVYRIVDGKIDKKWSKELTDFDFDEIFVDSRQRIWISTKGYGLLLIDNDKLEIINTTNNLVSNIILKIFEDFNGNIWIATQNGLSKYGKVVFEIYQNNFINNVKSILSIEEVGESLYFGTTEGLNILRDNKMNQRSQLLDRINDMPYSDFYSIKADDKNNIWLATSDGITRIEYNTPKYLPYNDFFPSEEVEMTTDLLKCKETLYCASTYGLLTYSEEGFSKYTMEDGLADNWIWTLSKDTAGNIWCGTTEGLSIFNGTTFHNYNEEDGLPHNYLSDIAFDSAGIAWIGTDNGISKVRLNKDWTISCENLDLSHGLGSDIIWSVLVDDKGYIWAGHNLGLNRIDPSTGKVVQYSAQEGFLPVETSQGAAVLTSSKEIWFGTVSGAVKYIPENDIISNDPPKVYINSIRLFNDNTDLFQFAQGKDELGVLPNNLSLPYNKNDLVFRYVGLHYTIIEKNRYKYMLEGYDSDWSEETSSIVTPPYRKLPPGKYTFKVMAANCDGVWTEIPAEFSFEIRPPFWRTWWFYTLEGLTAILLLYLFVRLRERKLRQDKQILTQKVKERTIEVEKQRDQIASQKKEMTDSILYAERIQSAVLPKSEYIDTLLDEYFILFKPRDIVSGDFYWINGKDGKVVVVAADCTGHGVPGAFMSMLGVSILNELASSPEQMTSDVILNLLRDHLTKTLRQTGKSEDAKDGMDLALCILDIQKMEVQFSGAYNPMVHIRDGECLVYKGDKMPVGFHLGNMKPFTSQVIEVKKGDCLYMFSDGYADQFGGEDDKKFKTANLRKLLTNNSYLPMTEQKVLLDETIEDWKGIKEQVDDILVIGIRI